MAKRFTDTEKWKKTWYRKLSPKEKCFWQYLVDNCNHAGVWDVDFELASIFIGETLNEAEIRNSFEKQFKEISNGKKWFIRDFIEFQYIELNPDNRAHNSVINILKKEGVYKGLIRGLQGCKDTYKDKDKDKDMVNIDENREFFTNKDYQLKAISYLVEKGVDEKSATSEIKKFIDYWTEPNKSKSKVKWELQQTFDVKRRLANWLNNASKFNGKQNSNKYKAGEL